MSERVLDDAARALRMAVAVIRDVALGIAESGLRFCSGHQVRRLPILVGYPQQHPLLLRYVDGRREEERFITLISLDPTRRLPVAQVELWSKG